MQLYRHFCAEVLMARKDRAFGDGFKETGLAGASTTNHNDTWQLKVLLQLVKATLCKVFMEAAI